MTTTKKIKKAKKQVEKQKRPEVGGQFRANMFLYDTDDHFYEALGMQPRNGWQGYDEWVLD